MEQLAAKQSLDINNDWNNNWHNHDHWFDDNWWHDHDNIGWDYPD